MRKERVQYQDDDYNVEMEVGQATVEMGLTRAELWFRTRTDGLDDRPLLARVALLQTYPACVAGTLSVRNLPQIGEDGEPLLDEDGKEILYPKQLVMDTLTLDVFLSLPEMMVALWKDAVFDLNAHWLPEMPEDEEAGEEGEVKEPGEETS